MPPPTPRRGSSHAAYRTILLLAALVVVVAGLRAAAEILLPLLVAVFLSILAAPPVLWLESRKVPTALAVVVVILGVVTGLAAFGALLVTSVSDFREALPRYKVGLQEHSEHLQSWLARFDLDLTFGSIFGAVEPGSVIDVLGTTLSSILAAMMNTTLVVLLMVFILLEAAGFPRKLRASMRDPNADLSRYARVTVEVQRYLAVKTAMSLVTGLAVCALTWALGVDFPMLWGLTAFLFNYIPNVGSILAAVPALIITLVQLGLGYTMAVGAGYLVINTVMGNIIEPQLMGNRLGLSPLVVFASLVLWGWIWGPVGMLLSVPLTVIVKIVLENNEETAWIAVLLGATPPPEGDPGSSLIDRVRWRRRRAGGGNAVPRPPSDPT